MPDSAIPVGRYWIVDRPEGSLVNRLYAWGKDVYTGNDHSQWFDLFSESTMSDSVFISGTARGSFRLNPVRPDGSGISQGCITFFRPSDFQLVRQKLSGTKKVTVRKGNMTLSAYGRVDVMGESHFDACRIR